MIRNVKSYNIKFYKVFLLIFNFYNAALFDNKVQNCMITIKRDKNTLSLYTNDKWIFPNKITIDEIILNPKLFSKHSLFEICELVVFLMTDSWQNHHGLIKKRNGHHNKEWSSKMSSFGLIPSNTDVRGGKRTGKIKSIHLIRGKPFHAVTPLLLNSEVFKSYYHTINPDLETITSLGKKDYKNSLIQPNTSSLIGDF